ncbi:MAG: thiamine-phosphate kinase [Alistipes sp.]|nr:thiamine-phosphate kinase [Alistipes sp.]
MKKSEFGFIGDIATMFGALPHHGFEPIGDDCTVLPMGDEALVMTTDMLIEDVHFLRFASSAEEVGNKSLMVNISDVAAMGAKPVATLLSIALPESAQGEWAERFMRGYHEASEREGVALVGGDTTASKDKIAINVVAIGRAPLANIKRRSDAKVGDVVAVTGKLGASSKGLVDIMFGDPNTSAAKIHRQGQARTAEGAWLGTRSEVHAMMDISDGIASDIKHIMELSKVGAEISLEKIPTDYDIRFATTGGEDYELLLTADAASFDTLADELHNATGTTLTAIGTITEGDTLSWLDNGAPTELELKGFTHF